MNKIDINKFVADRLQPMTKMLVQIKHRPNNWVVVVGLVFGSTIGFALYAAKIALVLWVISKLGFWFGSMFLMVFGVLWRLVNKHKLIKEELDFITNATKEGKF